MGWGRGPFHPSCRDSSILAGCRCSPPASPAISLSGQAAPSAPATHLLLRRRRGGGGKSPGCWLHGDVRQVRPVAGGGCGRVLAPVRETHGLGGRLGRLVQVGWPPSRTTLRPRLPRILLLLSTRQPQPPLIILQLLLQQQEEACTGPAARILLLQLVLHSANCSQSSACPSESKLMQHTHRPNLQQNKTRCQRHLMHIALSVKFCCRSRLVKSSFLTAETETFLLRPKLLSRFRLYTRHPHIHT